MAEMLEYFQDSAEPVLLFARNLEVLSWSRCAPPPTHTNEISLECPEHVIRFNIANVDVHFRSQRQHAQDLPRRIHLRRVRPSVQSIHVRTLTSLLPNLYLFPLVSGIVVIYI